MVSLRERFVRIEWDRTVFYHCDFSRTIYFVKKFDKRYLYLPLRYRTRKVYIARKYRKSRMVTRTCMLEVHLLAWYEVLFFTRARTQYADETLTYKSVKRGEKFGLLGLISAVLMLGRRRTHMVTSNEPTLVVSSKPCHRAQTRKNYSFLECSRVLSVQRGRSIWPLSR